MNNILAITLGGFLPAIFWGITAVLQKQSAVGGVRPATYLALFGLTIFTIGVIGMIGQQSKFFPSRSGIVYAIAAGTLYALGTGLLSFVLYRWQFEISKLAPILATNVLVTVGIGLLMGESANSNPVTLLIGTGFILVGVVFVLQS